MSHPQAAMPMPSGSETGSRSVPNWPGRAREQTSSPSSTPVRGYDRPLDFLHLFSLVRRVWPKNDEYRIYGNVLMGAIDILGEGMSFRVSLHPIKEALRAFMNERAGYDIGDKSVMKGLKFLDDYNNNIAKKSLYYASLREIRALTHLPLRSHPNIIKLLAVGWEPDYNHHDVAWPFFVLEYSEEGTLKDYQRGKPKMEFLEKMQLCEDVGRALLAIHGSGIVHGDVKTENILTFWSAEKGRMVGKIGDFGSSVLDFREDEHSGLPAHTIPWNAPEYDEAIPREHLKFTDVYSFGMLIFRVMLGGINPFKIAPFKSDEVDIELRSQQLKKDPQFLSLVAAMLCERCDASEADAVCEVLEFTLQYLPTQRNLEKAVIKLRELTGNTEDIPPVTLLEEFDYEDIDFEADCMKEDSFCVRASIIHALEAVASSNSVHAHKASFQLFQLLLSRYGTGITSATDMALTWLTQYADSGGYDGIGHLVGRILESLGVQLDEGIPLEALLRQGALKGSHTAFEDLKKYYPDAYDETLALFRECGGAMGMSQQSALFSWVDVRSLEGIADAIENSPGVELCGIHVTENEDTLLHCAARSGYLEVVKGLISLGIDVNVTNRLGETPLLESSRAGHYEVSKCLMEAGAMAGKTSIFGQGAIHFLPFFDEQHIDSISELMVRNGADVEEWAAENPRDGEHGFWGHSPLHYAVARNHIASIRALLRLGADPYAKGNGRSAIRWACMLSRAEALDMMAAASSRILSSEDSAAAPLVEAVLGPANRLEIVKEHGGNHENARIATLKILHKYKAINYRDMYGCGGCTVLHYAAMAGYPQVVDYLLAHTPSKQHLNIIYSDKTPLIVVINTGYRDVFDVLLRHGADIHLELPTFWRRGSYLHVCATTGHQDVFFPEQLLKHGALVDRTDEVGRTPFSLAVVQCNYPVADLLLQHGANRDYAYEGSTILARCLEIPIPLKGIKYLMTCKSNPEMPPPSFICSPGLDRNVFHAIAAAGTDAEKAVAQTKGIFQYLRELWPREEHINACDGMGIPPLGVAVAYPKEDFINMMIVAGADPNLGPVPPLRLALLRQNWANEQVRKVGGRWSTRRIKRIADNVVVILKGAGARADIDPRTGISRGFDVGKVLGRMTAEDIKMAHRGLSAGIEDIQAGVTERYGQRAIWRKICEAAMTPLPGTSPAKQVLPLPSRESASQSSATVSPDHSVEPSSRNHSQNTPPSTQDTQLNRRERGRAWKSQLGKGSGTAMGSTNGIQLPKAGSEESLSRDPGMSVNPGRGIPQPPPPSSSSPPPTYRPPSRGPGTSASTWRGILQLSPSNGSPSASTYRPPPRKPGSSRGARRDILRSSPSNTTRAGAHYGLPPRRSAEPPARRSPPPSLLDTPVPSSLSPCSPDILSPTHRSISQLPQPITPTAPGDCRPPPLPPVPAPLYSSSAASSPPLESGNLTTPTVTLETQLALAPPQPQASLQSLQSFSPRQGISQLSPPLQQTPHARHRSSSSFPYQIPWTITHQKPPHEILDTLRPAVLPFITALVDSRHSNAIPRRNLKICLESHLCVPNLIDLKWDPVAPLGSSSVKELQSGVNEMLKGFSITINLKLRVEMGGEHGTRTMLRVLMDEDGGSIGGSDGWLRTEGAGWEDLERIEAGIMFPQKT